MRYVMSKRVELGIGPRQFLAVALPLLFLSSPGADFPGIKDNGLDERFVQ
jgi:hypothetical protein